MAHSKEAHAKMNGMGIFNKDHWEHKHEEPMLAEGKYTEGEMRNPEHLKKSENALASYAKKHKMKY